MNGVVQESQSIALSSVLSMLPKTTKLIARCNSIDGSEWKNVVAANFQALLEMLSIKSG